MDISTFAPVVIPTLNRFDHFRRCLESLERCTGAEKTDVYVGLDYPPSDKYLEGWKKINAYLKEKEKKNGFHQLLVYRREHNCGINGGGSNNALLYAEVRKVSDRYILTEDDNEFSPLFLEFINEGLLKYKNNPNVYAICGYNPPVEMSDYPYNIYASYGLSGWGMGLWFDKTISYNLDEIQKTLKCPRQMMKIYRRSPNLVYALLDMLDKGLVWGDTCIPFYNIINNSFCIFPRISFVRNWGHDGSGINCGEGADELFVNQRIFSGENFNMDEIEIKETESKAVKKYIRQTYNYKKRIRLLIKIAKFYLKNNG